jgi:hypothetical protein
LHAIPGKPNSKGFSLKISLIKNNVGSLARLPDKREGGTYPVPATT